MSYAEVMLSRNLQDIHDAPAGSRNMRFSRAAYRMYQFTPIFGQDMLTSILEQEGRQIGLDRQEIRDTLRSAQKGAAKHPLPAATLAKARAESPMPTMQQSHAPEPPEAVQEPSKAWQTAAQGLLDYCQDRLWESDAALDYLAQERKLHELTVQSAKLGYNPTRLIRSRAKWGLPHDDEGSDALYLPAGIVIPYYAARQLHKIEIRSIPSGKYTIPGSANMPWNTDRLTSKTAMLVEGVFNALSVQQEAPGLIIPVALGAATHARRIKWIALLSACPLVLISTDVGQAGDAAAAYWLDVLKHNSRRWRPYVDDVNTMLTAGMDVRAWVQAGLEVG